MQGTPRCESTGLFGEDIDYDDDTDRVSLTKRPNSDARRRLSTDFPNNDVKEDDLTTIGPWREVTVERQVSNPWLLIGRRHSVDDRRHSVEETKALFLGTLAAKVDDGSRVQIRCLANAEEIKARSQNVWDELSRQEHALKACRDFWIERQAADEGYVGRLDALALVARKSEMMKPYTSTASTAMKSKLKQEEAEWRAQVQHASSRSAGMAAELPRIIEQHSRVANEVSRSVTSATEEVQVLTMQLQSSRASLWSGTGKLRLSSLPGSHAWDALGMNTGDDARSGSQSPCCWFEARTYLVVLSNLLDTQCVAMARLRRQERRLSLLGDWVQQVMESGPSDGILTAQMPSMRDSKSPQAEVDSVEQEYKDMIRDIDLSALIVHQMEARMSIDADGSDSTIWMPVLVILFVDLWLHIWTSDKEGDHDLRDLWWGASPTYSIPLLHHCNRPVAKVVDAESKHGSRIVQINFKLEFLTLESITIVDVAASAVAEFAARTTGIASRLKENLLSPWKRWSSHGKTNTGTPPANASYPNIFIRCADEGAAEDFIGALGLLEQLYPFADSDE
eukprot:TRINITY_DN27207_c0_g1_i1.p1 TRINITY_DN27207_c0_g1~~TRINITY_DN27207_c0_g1_i1.p1  ORF type:complete len:581 (+),score=61.23 TRINITY_DN27207_c0_g1_i1:54-1745(+)